MYETRNFKAGNNDLLSCPCCGDGGLSVATLMLLEIIRGHFQAPVTVVSGARCKSHNKKVGGAKHSTHLIDDEDTIAEGCDIKVEGVSPTKVVVFLKTLPFANLLGIGKYSTWVHIDTRGYAARW